MKDWNGADKSLRRQYIVNDLPDCIEPQEKNLLRKMILSPHASYVTFEDKIEKPMVIQYVGSASITYVEWKFQQWHVQIIICTEYRQNI